MRLLREPFLWAGIQRRQAMPPPRVIAGVVALADAGKGGKLPARAGTKLVDDAGNLAADLTSQGHATRRLGRGATHAGHDWRQIFDQRRRHDPARYAVNLAAME